MRVLINQDPFFDKNAKVAWDHRGKWQCKWVQCPEAGNAPAITAFRKSFDMKKDAVVRVHVSADERYELFLDGKRIGRGSERGNPENWFFETYDIPMTKGSHLIVARVWALGEWLMPVAQMSVYPGFIFAPQEQEYIDLLGTGVSEWEARMLGGYEFLCGSGTGAKETIDGKQFSWGFEFGKGDGWQTVTPMHEGCFGRILCDYSPQHLMRPAILPPMIEKEITTGVARFVSQASSTDTSQIPVRKEDNLADEIAQWDLLQGRKSVTIPAQTIRRVIFDLEDYYCVYPELVTSGGKGSMVRMEWAESLFLRSRQEFWGNDTKGNRDEIEGKYFFGLSNTFLPDGGTQRKFETLWWQAGRYIEMVVKTEDEALTIDALRLHETRYPLESEAEFSASDSRLQRVIPPALRTLQMCSHETYMDCPYYEQLMYVGDSRLEALITFMITHDDHLPRKCLEMFNASRINSGLTQSRFPSRIPQVIPPFSLWWTTMVHDYAFWRDDFEFIRSLMPGVRAVVNCYQTYLNADGLIQGPNGWNFMDWVPGWDWGVPPEGIFGTNGSINWQTVYALTRVAELEDLMGEPELAQRTRRMAHDLAQRATEVFWDEERGLFADNPDHSYFCEHTSCLAVLSGQLDEARMQRIARELPRAKNIDRTTIYFTHYLFETCRVLGLMDLFFDRMSIWFDLEKHGFKTCFEQPEPTRSDCHAWASHPMFHYFSTILGIRPASPGFRTVEIRPQLGSLTWAKGTIAHPQGMISADLRLENGKLTGVIELPKGTTGTLISQNQTMVLKEGRQDIL